MKGTALNKDQVLELLEVMRPDEIREFEKNRLPADMIEFLTERESNPGLEDAFREVGLEIRHWKLAQDLPMPTYRSRPSWKNSPWVGSVSLATAATFFLLSFIFWITPERPCGHPLQDPHIRSNLLENMAIANMSGSVNLQRIIDDPELQPFNTELFMALKARGLGFFEKAQREKNLAYFREALADFQQAFELQKDPEIRSYVIQIIKLLKSLGP